MLMALTWILNFKVVAAAFTLDPVRPTPNVQYPVVSAPHTE